MVEKVRLFIRKQVYQHTTTCPVQRSAHSTTSNPMRSSWFTSSNNHTGTQSYVPEGFRSNSRCDRTCSASLTLYQAFWYVFPVTRCVLMFDLSSPCKPNAAAAAAPCCDVGSCSLLVPARVELVLQGVGAEIMMALNYC
ncbi:membrane-associated guanylate kinase, WW and PDZ domain-containing protein 2 isoform 2 [Anopheles sinensis]|uniref:Membrane-associated guanylate kinase, WW and PDZ domain-containing protein 2 isoform 2 n=1 Tax=Anopheles sinensis TaxID=74873 RepID=A0A084W1J6_ANOSI|nr:membrane-associated guanylate kinase, WW and PDZ domain-containing protein 2 isoform 2 [Anopheles sinensis]